MSIKYLIESRNCCLSSKRYRAASHSSKLGSFRIIPKQSHGQEGTLAFLLDAGAPVAVRVDEDLLGDGRKLLAGNKTKPKKSGNDSITVDRSHILTEADVAMLMSRSSIDLQKRLISWSQVGSWIGILYGRHCGWDSNHWSVSPINALDGCCQTHDREYDQNKLTWNGCSPTKCSSDARLMSCVRRTSCPKLDKPCSRPWYCPWCACTGGCSKCVEDSACENMKKTAYAVYETIVATCKSKKWC
jgi:hypothetical protein